MTALPKRQQNRILRERRILDAALVVFSQKGFVSASMDDIAAEAGLTKPTLYQYFPSKDELFTAMMTEERDHMLESFEYPPRPAWSPNSTPSPGTMPMSCCAQIC